MQKNCAINKHIAAFATYFFLLPLVYFIPTTLQNTLAMTKLTNILLSVGVIVLLMSYLIMPLFMKAYAKFVCTK